MTEYHFVLTAASPTGKVGTFDGVINVRPDATRASLYGEAVQYAKSQMQETGVHVLFFSLELNELPVTV